MSEYQERDIVGMDEEGDYYMRHIAAMTKEDLRSKSDIAAELGYRDMTIERLTEENRHLRKALTESQPNINQFREMYLCHWTVSSREQLLQERLQQYYLETPDSMSNVNARIKWKEFREWCQVMGYSVEEINKAKRARQYHMP